MSFEKKLVESSPSEKKEDSNEIREIRSDNETLFESEFSEELQNGIRENFKMLKTLFTKNPKLESWDDFEILLKEQGILLKGNLLFGSHKELTLQNIQSASEMFQEAPDEVMDFLARLESALMKEEDIYGQKFRKIEEDISYQREMDKIEKEAEISLERHEKGKMIFDKYSRDQIKEFTEKEKLPRRDQTILGLSRLIMAKNIEIADSTQMVLEEEDKIYRTNQEYGVSVIIDEHQELLENIRQEFFGKKGSFESVLSEGSSERLHQVIRLLEENTFDEKDLNPRLQKFKALVLLMVVGAGIPMGCSSASKVPGQIVEEIPKVEKVPMEIEDDKVIQQPDKDLSIDTPVLESTDHGEAILKQQETQVLDQETLRNEIKIFSEDFFEDIKDYQKDLEKLQKDFDKIYEDLSDKKRKEYKELLEKYIEIVSKITQDQMHDMVFDIVKECGALEIEECYFFILKRLNTMIVDIDPHSWSKADIDFAVSQYRRDEVKLLLYPFAEGVIDAKLENVEKLKDDRLKVDGKIHAFLENFKHELGHHFEAENVVYYMNLGGTQDVKTVLLEGINERIVASKKESFSEGYIEFKMLASTFLTLDRKSVLLFRIGKIHPETFFDKMLDEIENNLKKDVDAKNVRTTLNKHLRPYLKKEAGDIVFGGGRDDGKVHGHDHGLRRDLDLGQMAVHKVIDPFEKSYELLFEVLEDEMLDEMLENMTFTELDKLVSFFDASIPKDQVHLERIKKYLPKVE